jgi:hypothetical protein
MISYWQERIPEAASIYTIRKNDNGELVFICCPPADLNRDGVIYGEEEELVPLGEIYEIPKEYLPEEYVPEIFHYKTCMAETKIAPNLGYRSFYLRDVTLPTRCKRGVRDSGGVT